MKSIVLFLLILFLSALNSCEKYSHEYLTGEGIEFYATKIPYQCNLNVDYSKINFDTIVLTEQPFIKYNDILTYNSINHIVRLGFSHDLINFKTTSVYGRMFVVTLNKKPKYCGFYWLNLSSVPCNWIYIMEPYKELDNLQDNEIKISLSETTKSDPRLDSGIVIQLKLDKKLK